MLGIALGLLVDEGELRKVVERLDVGGLHAGGVEAALVVDGVVVGVLHHGLQALELQLLKLGARHALDFRIVVLLVVRDVLLCHDALLLGSRSAGGRFVRRGFAVRIETLNHPVFNAGY